VVGQVDEPGVWGDRLWDQMLRRLGIAWPKRRGEPTDSDFGFNVRGNQQRAPAAWERLRDEWRRVIDERRAGGS